MGENINKARSALGVIVVLVARLIFPERRRV